MKFQATVSQASLLLALAFAFGGTGLLALSGLLGGGLALLEGWQRGLDLKQKTQQELLKFKYHMSGPTLCFSCWCCAPPKAYSTWKMKLARHLSNSSLFTYFFFFFYPKRV